LIETFRQRFGKEPTVRVSAPGRVNLIGEHVDYNGGSVLPIATPQRAYVQLALRSDDLVKVFSVEKGQGDWVLGQEQRGRGWLDYFMGITRTLDQQGLRGAGFELWFHSDVPVGAGLSSSAALEVSLLKGLRELWGLTLTDLELALLAQKSENGFVGANVGIMDQVAASLGNASTALLLDTVTLQTRAVSLPERVKMIVIDSGLKHSLVGGDYNLRRQECEQAARALGVKYLCELKSDALERAAKLEPPLNKRARHAITENERVHAAVAAIEGDDVMELGRLVNASHDSLRDDFEVSVPAIDRMVELARATEEVVGARITGGGFGGSVLILTMSKNPLEQAKEIARRYAQDTHQKPRVVVPVP
jgi:galactokinase